VSNDLIFYEFSRSQVERCDFSHFLGLYGADKLPKGHRLETMMSTLIFGIEGWDADPRAIHSIPEIRRFYTAFHEAWPYWLFFCNLGSEALSMMVFCCLPSLVAMPVDGSATVAVKLDRLELLHFIVGDFASMNLMCERAQLLERAIYDRSKAVFEYFGLPFDAEPPPNPASGHLCH